MNRAEKLALIATRAVREDDNGCEFYEHARDHVVWLLSEVERLEKALLDAKREHEICEDGYYSCPLSSEGSADSEKHGCCCGAEAHNERIDAALR